MFIRNTSIFKVYYWKTEMANGVNKNQRLVIVLVSTCELFKLEPSLRLYKIF